MASQLQYFISHTDAALVEAVRHGRREEFAAFAWQGEPPDPQSNTVFQHAKLNHHLRHEGQHARLREFYCELIRLRKTLPALATLNKETMKVCGFEQQKVLYVHRWHGEDEACLCVNFQTTAISLTLPFPDGTWYKRLDSAETHWYGPGSSVPARLCGEIDRLVLPQQSLILFTRAAMIDHSA